ncbi:MAG: DUF2958 domain-containing protein [Kouleothrix sp.]|jgi:hypothetical protein|nr:DUF2958 domain-containing protein [Kouleothrix sp.]
MKLLPENIRAQIPPLYATENEKDPIVQCKFFCPWNSWTWYVLEGDDTEYEDAGTEKFASDYIFFGWVNGDADEFGYFRLSELESAQGPYGLSIERDIGFEPCKLSVVKEHSFGVFERR